MKAIPTEWDGIKFRSRLEARWAVFFEELGVYWHYEPFEIGVDRQYLPDFFVNHLFFGQMTIVEIKPFTPNEQYIKYLAGVRDPNKSDFFIFVGSPSIIQPDGIRLYGRGCTIVQKGFSLAQCNNCGYYYVSSEYPYCSCEGEYNPPKGDAVDAKNIATSIRFDLI